MIRVGFIISRSGAGWIGGTNYLGNLLQAVADLPDRRIATTLFVPPDIDDALLSRLPADAVVRTPLVAARDPRRLIGKAIQRTTGRDVIGAFLARRHAIDVFSHVPPVPGARAASVSWIPDFQHEHLPYLFTQQQLATRRANDREMADGATLVLLSSHHAAADLERLYPQAVGRNRVLQFVSGLARAEETPPLADLSERYGLDGPFFYAPNQFWVHKNHGVIIDALALLKQRGRNAVVVCSGDTTDYRNPDHFTALSQRAVTQDVADRFKVVGLIPYGDVVGFMRHCVAVINPSLFEGWSTTVEEAKSQGKTTLLSDIPVHREQAPDRAIYFAPDDAPALADAMAATLDRFDIAAEERAAAAAGAALAARRLDFARRYQSIVEDAVERPRR